MTADDRPARSDPHGPEDPAAEEHAVTGLDLARSIARSLAGRGSRSGATGRRPRRGFEGRGGRAAGPQVSGAHPDDRDPQTLDATLARLVNEQGWSVDVRVHGVFARWSEIVGPEVAQHAAPVGYQREPDGGRLRVRTDSTAWATQMRLLAATVVRRLNEELGERTVTIIDVEGPTAPSWVRGRRSVRGGRGPRDTYG